MPLQPNQQKHAKMYVRKSGRGLEFFIQSLWYTANKHLEVTPLIFDVIPRLNVRQNSTSSLVTNLSKAFKHRILKFKVQDNDKLPLCPRCLSAYLSPESIYSEFHRQSLHYVVLWFFTCHSNVMLKQLNIGTCERQTFKTILFLIHLGQGTQIQYQEFLML